MPPTSDESAIAIIGGSGFYSLLDSPEERRVSTPYGDPSDSLFISSVKDREVVFLPRHNREHSLPPGRINYRANLWALRAAGVRQVLAPCSVGGLQPHLQPGTLVVPDQLVDRTTGRVNSFFDGEPRADGRVPAVAHLPFADPYCPRGRRTVIAHASRAGWQPEATGTLVVIQGPRFSTRAESRWHAAQGWSVVGMTGHPEAALARELGMCYTSVALVTDLDAGVEAGEGVTHEEVLTVFAANVERLRALMIDVVAELPHDGCACRDALPDSDVRGILA